MRPTLPHFFRAAAAVFAGMVALSAQPAAPARSPWADPPADELLQKLATATPTEKSALLCALSRVVEGDDLKKSLAQAEEAQRTATTPLDRLRADLRVIYVRRALGELPPALQLARAAEEQARAAGDPALHAEAVMLVGYVLTNQSQFAEAVPLLQRALALADALPDPVLRIRVRLVLAIAHYDIDQSKASLDYALAARSLAQENNLPALLADVLGNVAIGYQSTGDRASARAFYEESIALRSRTGGSGMLRGIGNASINLGLLLLEEGKTRQAIPVLQRAVEIHTQLGMKRNLANALKALAIAYREDGQLDESLRQFQRGLAVAEPLNTPSLMVRYHSEMAKLLEKRGDYRAALELERKAAAARETAASQATLVKLEELRAKSHAAHREQELKRLQQEREIQAVDLSRARWQRITLAAVVLLVVVGLAAVIQRLRLKNRVLAETLAAQHAAEAADRMKTRFLGIASHDIKGPLGNALHLAAELAPAVAAVPQAAETLVLLESEVRRVLSRTRDFLDIAALETGHLPLNLARTDLASIARAVLAEHRWLATAKGQQFVFNTDGDAALQGDAARLHQIIANLVENAVKYSPPGGTITIALTRRADGLALAVSDRGAGLAPTEMLELFKPFTRLGSRPTGGETSHGYGLSIAHELARLHGGRILVESQPGRGSTFTVELPCTIPAALA